MKVKPPKINKIHLEIPSLGVSQVIDFCKLKNIVLLYGTNGSGKTSILRIIYAIFQEEFSFLYRYPDLSVNIEFNEKKPEKIQQCMINFEWGSSNKEIIGIFGDGSQLFLNFRYFKALVYQYNNKYDEDSWFDFESDDIIESFTNLYDALQLAQHLWQERIERQNIDSEDIYRLDPPEKVTNWFKSVSKLYIHYEEDLNALERAYCDIYNQISQGEVGFSYLFEHSISIFKKTKILLDVFFGFELEFIPSNRVIITPSEIEEIVNELNQERKDGNFYIDDDIEMKEQLGLNDIVKQKIDTVIKDILWNKPKNQLLDSLFNDFLIHFFPHLKLFLNSCSIIEGEKEYNEELEKLRKKSLDPAEILIKRKIIHEELDLGPSEDLTTLSSGELNLVFLFVKLIYGVKKGTLILLDEPEISLHVGWQLDFVPFLEKMQAVLDHQILIATHSPLIIDEYLDSNAISIKSRELS